MRSAMAYSPVACIRVSSACWRAVSFGCLPRSLPLARATRGGDIGGREVVQVEGHHCPGFLVQVTQRLQDHLGLDSQLARIGPEVRQIGYLGVSSPPNTANTANSSSPSSLSGPSPPNTVAQRNVSLI
jgi:hypothetical protein